MSDYVTPETCEDRRYKCCETLTPQEHEAQYGYPDSGSELVEKNTTTCLTCGNDYPDADMMPAQDGEGEYCERCFPQPICARCKHAEGLHEGNGCNGTEPAYTPCCLACPRSEEYPCPCIDFEERKGA